MDLKVRIYDKIRKSNLRLTKSRQAMIEVLEDQHLTFKEIQRALAKKGFYNVSTIYNNLEFFISQKIIVELYIDDTKYYDLAHENPMHNADSHIHIVIKDTNKITEINASDIFDYINKHDSLKNLDLEYIRIIISAKHKK